MHGPDPIGIRQVDTNRRAGGGVSCFTHDIDHIVGDADHFFLFVLVHEWHVVLKPLRIVHHDRHTFRSLKVLDLDHRLIAASESERVIVDFNEPVDVIDVAFGIAYPVDVVQTPLFQIAGSVVVHQMPEGRPLLVVLGVFLRLL